tara:strand:+ start:2463 stop:3458 length:996 start_codon:yes stop_codon:yes gene_type:complete
MDEFNIDIIKESIEEESIFIKELINKIHEVIVGQKDLVQKLILAVLSNGHVFLEGYPGLAKTLTIKIFSQLIDTNYQRIQFTPDLLPADILGTLIYNQKESSFEVKKGPIFSNIILADEINRSPAKVQSALLEAMQEKQITIGEETFKLEDPFLVMATQNPIEQEGTYPLPEAQIDRFMFKLLVEYPSESEELEILNKMGKINKSIVVNPIAKPEQIFSARKLINQIYIAENIKKYIISLVVATRRPIDYGMKDLQNYINLGASPRATIFLAIASKAQAFLNGRGYVIPEDVRDAGKPILRHRIITTYEAEAEEITTEDIIQRIYESIPTP